MKAYIDSTAKIIKNFLAPYAKISTAKFFCFMQYESFQFINGNYLC